MFGNVLVHCNRVLDLNVKVFFHCRKVASSSLDRFSELFAMQPDTSHARRSWSPSANCIVRVIQENLSPGCLSVPTRILFSQSFDISCNMVVPALWK